MADELDERDKDLLHEMDIGGYRPDRDHQHRCERLVELGYARSVLTGPRPGRLPEYIYRITMKGRIFLGASR